MKIINEKIVTVTLTEGGRSHFRVRIPKRVNESNPLPVYSDVDWYIMPYKTLASETIPFVELMGNYRLIEHAADTITNFIIRNEYFPKFDIIMNPTSESNALAHSVACKLHQGGLGWHHTVVARSGAASSSALMKVWYKSITDSSKRPMHLTWDDTEYIKDKKILLIDNVYANGGTLGACKELIDNAGGEVAAIVTVATKEGHRPIDNLYSLFELPIIKSKGEK